ncbi:MAG: glycosyltransferase [Bacteroidota bacterium]
MAKILLVSAGFQGILNCSLALSKRLAKMGHEITHANPGDHKAKVEREGFPYFQLPPMYNPPKKERRFWGLLKPISSEKKLLGQIEFEEILQLVEPDLVIADIEFHEVIFTASGLSFPVVLLSPWFNHLSNDALPPLNSYLTPATNAEDLKELDFIRSTRKNKMNAKFKYNSNANLGSSRVAVLLRYAEQCDFSLNQLDYYNWPPPFTHSSLPLLLANLEELEFPHEKPLNHFYIGPQVWKNQNRQLDPNLREFLDRAKLRGDKIIYASAGTLSSAYAQFFERLVLAMRDKSDCSLVLSFGKSTRPNMKEYENIFADSFLPQFDILQEADLCIHHAGINTINECLLLGVPSLIYTHGKHDQPGCSARMQYQEMAYVGDIRNDDSASISRNIDKALADTALATRTRRMGELIGSKGYDERLQLLIESTISNH